MYKVLETKKIEEATYEYNDFNMIRDAQTWGDDVKFPNNTVLAMNGEDVNKLVADGIIPADKLASNGALNSAIWYVFRMTRSGKYLPLHVTMRPETAANIERGSRRYGSLSIDKEVFG